VSYEQDYILRLARQLAEVVARILGLGRTGQLADALAVAERAYGDLLGLPAGLIDRIDAATLLGLLRSPDEAHALIDLLEAEAVVLEASGDTARAARRRELATGLRAARV